MTARAVLTAGMVAAAVFAAAACTSEKPQAGPPISDPGPRPSALPSPSPSQPVAPLSGLPVAADLVARRPVAVPVRVGSGSPAPAGLDAADLVYQEYAERGSLRLLGVFQSRDAARVGPVAEVRPADVKTLEVLQPFVGYASGTEGFIEQVANAGLPAVSRVQRSDVFPDGFTSTERLRSLAPAASTTPPRPFVHSGRDAPLANRTSPAATLTVTAPGRPAQVWTFDPASRMWRTDLGDTPVSAASVVVLTMEYKTLSVKQPYPRDLPSAAVLGSGAATAVSGPAAATGTWSKPGLKQLCNVVGEDSFQLQLRPGPTWVIYAPAGSTVVTA